MPRRRLVLLISALVLLPSLVLVAVVYYFERGPGLEAEAGRLERIMDLRAGMTVAEIGAGKGRMAVRLARRLGASGRLYTTELDAGLIGVIRLRVEGNRLTNVVTIQGSEHSTGLPEACCDAIYMRRVYHHFTDAAAMNKAIYAALHPGGRLAVIDFLSPSWLVFIRHGISRDTVAAQVSAAGFQLERRADRWSPIDYCLVFRKPL